MNMQVRIASLPQGQPQESDFELVRGERPQPGPGQILVRTRWLSLDPYVRSLLSGRHFLRMPQPGDVMPANAVAEVVESRHPVHAVGRPARARDRARGMGSVGWRCGLAARSAARA
jgi:NADPH-dependent curcumin reductase